MCILRRDIGTSRREIPPPAAVPHSCATLVRTSRRSAEGGRTGRPCQSPQRIAGGACLPVANGQFVRREELEPSPVSEGPVRALAGNMRLFLPYGLGFPLAS